ncbi:MAG: alpha/beta hydrolase family protein [Kangiellaceae bacterium]
MASLLLSNSNRPTIDTSIDQASLVYFKVHLKRFIILFSSLVLFACEQSQEVAHPNQMVASKSIANDTVIEPQYGYDSQFHYPQFSGKYQVASMEVTLTDHSRVETLSSTQESNNLSEPRRFNLRFYYPSAQVGLQNSEIKPNFNLDLSEKLPVISETAWANLIGPQIRNGKMLRFSNYRNAFWNIKLNQKVSEDNSDFPIVIFSHGYGYSPEAYSALSAELASHGYIVASLNHTFGANPTELVKKKNQIKWAKKLPTENMGEYLPIWSDDQIFVIEELNKLNSDDTSPFYQRLNLSQLGVFGHSYGGAAAYLTAARDPRVKAFMNLDGTLFQAGNFDVYQPFAYLLSKNHLPFIQTSKLNSDAFLIKLKQFEHASFTDHILWWQWDFDNENLGLGDVNGVQAVEQTSYLVRSFFDAYLLHNNQSWDSLTQENTPSRSSKKVN